MTHRRSSGRARRAKQAVIDLATWPRLDLWLANRSTLRSIRNPRVGVSVRGAAVSSGSATLIVLGAYEAAELRCIRRCPNRSESVLEIGSGAGVVSANIVAGMNRGLLRVVEANVGVLGALRANLERNRKPEVKIDIRNAALDYSGNPTVQLQVPESHLGASRQLNAHLAEPQAQFTVPTATISELTKDMPSFGLVCDIEGAEADFIFGPEPALERCDWLCIELHDTTYSGRDVSRDDLVSGLLAKGFALKHRDGAVFVFDGPAGALARA